MKKEADPKNNNKSEFTVYSMWTAQQQQLVQRFLELVYILDKSNYNIKGPHADNQKKKKKLP